MIRSSEIRKYVNGRLEYFRTHGVESVVLVSGEIHKELGLQNRMPMVCGAMYHLMKSGDEILHSTPSGYSSTIKIEYQLL